METELLVVGGGPAGYTAAIRSAQCGLTVTLVEDENVRNLPQPRLYPV